MTCTQGQRHVGMGHQTGQHRARRRLGGTPGTLTSILLLLVLLPAARADEVVNTDFDLAGWLRQGVVTLGSDHFDTGSLHRLLDGSTSTGVRDEVDGTVLISLSFQPPQFVRKVSLRPGNPSSYAVQLTLLPVDGQRRSYGEQVVSGGNQAMFRPIDERLSAIELSVECLELEQVVNLAELRVGGELSLRAIELEDLPESLPEGGAFDVRVRGLDSFGGRPDLTPFAEILVNPGRAIERLSKTRYKTRVGGPIDMVPRLGRLEGPLRSMMVRQRDPAPEEPSFHTGFGVVQLQLQGEPPFRVLRRTSGEKQAHPLGITWNHNYYDDSVKPGLAYQYSVERVDRFGNALSEVSDENRLRTRTRPPTGLVDIGRCPVLVALYVDSFDRNGGRGERQRIEQSIEAARGFVFRHSGARIVLDVSTVAIRGPTPSTTGPSMGGIERDLRHLGIGNDDFGMVLAVSNDFEAGHGNFVLLGHTGGAFGRGPGVPTPNLALGPDPDVAWVFVHELRHVMAGRIAPSAGSTELPSGDLEQDFRFGPLGAFRGRPLDLGEGWDGQSVLWADADWWAQVQPPYRRPFEVIDSDGDGLPDADTRLPFDEARFGSSPDLADTDGDGLLDLDEAMQGVYGGSDPTRLDSDGDGLEDGEDPWPLSDFRGVIPYGSEPSTLAGGGPEGASGPSLASCWNEQVLVLRVTTPEAADVFIDLDGSGRLGRWESDVDVGPPGERSPDVWCGPARIALRAHQPPTGVFVGDRRVSGATLAVTTLADGSVALTARLPVALGAGAADATVSPYAKPAPGLALRAGSVFGLAVTVRPPRANDPTPWEAFPHDLPWRSLFETHRLYDAELAPPPGD